MGGAPVPPGTVLVLMIWGNWAAPSAVTVTIDNRRVSLMKLPTMNLNAKCDKLPSIGAFLTVWWGRVTVTSVERNSRFLEPQIFAQSPVIFSMASGYRFP